MMRYKRVALIGLGLIASSIALAIKRFDDSIKIAGFSRSQKTREQAAKLFLCEVFESASDAVKGADLVILCVPVGAMGLMMKEISSSLMPGATVTDVGSVKVAVIDHVKPYIIDKINFVPGHPIAGTENSGPTAGFNTLFDNRWCILTPMETTDKIVIDSVKEFWECLGSKVHTMEASHHDLVLAVTSHAPHLIAYTMVGVADDFAKVTESEVINYSAAGFRDFTRLAASDPVMWRDVFLYNKEAALQILGRFSEELFSLQKAIRRSDGEFLENYFERTRKIRRDIIEAGQESPESNFGRDDAKQK